ncbi:matrix remodeling-associated protein 8-like isoform X1 [Stigmatopora nigra]
MKSPRMDIIFQALFLIHISAIFLFTAVQGQPDSSSIVPGYNVSAPAGSTVTLQCVSGRMVWTRDNLKDRQRVVHWDLYRPHADNSMERILDMYSAGEQRIYNSYNMKRVGLSQKAFKDGNFSLFIKDVTMNDRGLYSCNLHHLYCHIYETVRVQLNVTKSRRKEQRFWDGQKAVFVVLLGSTVVLPCVNRRNVWTDWSNEEENQQVVHWDRQFPGIHHDRADRLVDLYASGEQRSYGASFLRRKMNISNQAFTEGDFSLTISDLQATDEGMYSCHLHHHYCGLHERRQFQVNVESPVIHATVPAKALPSADKDVNEGDSPQVITVVIPEQRHHFLLPLGFVLTAFLLLAFVVLIIILITRRRKTELYSVESTRSNRSHRDSEEFEMEVTEAAFPIREPDDRLDYKNNLLKEVNMNSPTKVVDLDKGSKCKHTK